MMNTVSTRFPRAGPRNAWFAVMPFSLARANTQRVHRETQSLDGPTRCRRKFLAYFPEGFHDETYVDWERAYKWQAHRAWQDQLAPETIRSLIRSGDAAEVAARAVRIESRTNLLFSFEKMALRDAVRTPRGAQTFARGLLDLLHGTGSLEVRFERWIDAVESLPRRQTRVLTWPLVTVFGFIAQPRVHIFLKPNVTRIAAQRYGFTLPYASRPGWSIYQALLAFGARIRTDLRDLKPRDQIDIQSFIWVQGSDEYPPRRG